MHKQITAFGRGLLLALTALAISSFAATAHAQAPAPGDNPLNFRVDGPTQRLEMIVNTSRILTLPRKIPRL
ncbi:MAG: hypothetical protein KDA41_10325, partial [Planctomycetales bacterium]|nr:hypothetical protein [Planctomycetales bacterium]